MQRFTTTTFLILILCLTAQAQIRVLIAYDTVDGHTERLAGWIAKGVRSQDDTVLRLKRVDQVTDQDLLWADAILVGSPVYNTGLTPPVSKFLAEWPFEGNPLKNKVGAAFVSAQGATAGEETAILTILRTMLVFQMLPVGGDDWRSGFGVAYILDISDERVLGFTKDQARRLGKRVCEVARLTDPMRQGLP